jgi:hypothetical protein
VRGRDIEVYVGTRGTDQVLLHGMQSFELTASIDTAADREMGYADVTGRSVNGTDATGTATMRPTDRSHFFDALSKRDRRRSQRGLRLLQHAQGAGRDQDQGSAPIAPTR